MEYDYDEDPYGMIPVGYKYGKATVIGFTAPAGPEFDRLMVKISYGAGSWTTQHYMCVFREFCLNESHETFTKARMRQQVKRGKEALNSLKMLDNSL